MRLFFAADGFSQPARMLGLRLGERGLRPDPDLDAALRDAAVVVSHLSQESVVHCSLMRTARAVALLSLFRVRHSRMRRVNRRLSVHWGQRTSRGKSVRAADHDAAL